MLQSSVKQNYYYYKEESFYVIVIILYCIYLLMVSWDKIGEVMDF